MIDPPEVVSEEDPASPQPQSPVSDSVFLPEADDEPMNSDKSEMIVILEEVERTRQNLFQAQELFDGTRNRNAVDQLEYQQLKAIGMANFSEHVMHQLQFPRGSMNTRVLIEAEQEHEEAKAMARAHGFLENQLDQESDFVDNPDDGYLESQDANMIAVPNEGHIHDWTDEVVECQNPFPLQSEETELDDWEKRTVAMFDTLSCVDLDLDHRRRIAQWQR